MADDTLAPENVIEAVDAEVGETKSQEEAAQPASYKVVGETKIPVSQFTGKLWQSRRDAGVKSVEDYSAACKEAIRYYLNDQMGHRQTREGEAGNLSYSNRRNRKLSETENVVFATVSAMLPAIYAKNPVAEITARDNANQDFADAVEQLVNTLAGMKTSPGFNIKPKAKQAVVLAMVTNVAHVEVGYTLKENSSQKALEDLKVIAEKLEKAADQNEIRELEGQLQAIEEGFDFLQPEGPFVRLKRPGEVIIDPDSVEPDYSDAAWMMLSYKIPTMYLTAKYGKEIEGQDKRYESIYKPTHVLFAGTDKSADDLVNSFKLLQNTDENPATYGYNDQNAFERAWRTQVWVVWDKTTRRVFMFHDQDWSWPIWVWDDPYKLQTFFPLSSLAFHMPPVGNKMNGEITYYLDQQDAINEINDEERRARQSIRENVIYNSNVISKDEFDAANKGYDGTARGIPLPEGTKLSDHMLYNTPASLQFPQIFGQAKAAKIEAIDRLTGTNEVMRGAQFKTNTTNQAIDTYDATTQLRVDAKIDAIEDFIGDIFAKVAALCVANMDPAVVSTLIGPKYAESWRNMSAKDFELSFPMEIIGGSSQKPTSPTKKKEAISLGQTLGQFANASPAVILVMLRVLERAFNEVVIGKDDWRQIEQSIQLQMQRGNSTGGGQPTPSNGQPTPSVSKGIPINILDQLPPKLKLVFSKALIQGVPAAQILQEIEQSLGGEGATTGAAGSA